MLELEAVTYLKQLRILIKVSEAVAFLEECRQNYIFYWLYKKLFSNEWIASTTSLERSNTYEYSPREKEFLKLVNEQLFPIPYESDLDEERTSTIPIISYEFYSDEAIEDLDLAIILLLSLLEPEYELALQAELEIYPQIQRNLNWMSLSEKCQQLQNTPLAFLYEALSVIDHSTGCIFIDSSIEMYESLDWSEESVLALAADWQQCQEIWDRFNQLTDWLVEKKNCFELIEFWNQCHELT